MRFVALPHAIDLTPRRMLIGLRWLAVGAASLLVLHNGVTVASFGSAVLLGMLLGQETFTFWLAGRDLAPLWSWLLLVLDLAGVGLVTAFCSYDAGYFFLLYPLFLVDIALRVASRVAYLWTAVVGAVYIAALLGGAWLHHHTWTELDWILLALELVMLVIVTGISLNLSILWRARLAQIDRLALLDDLSLLLADTRQLDEVLASLVELVPAALHVQACVIAIDEPGSGRRIWANLGADTSAMIDEALLAPPEAATAGGTGGEPAVDRTPRLMVADAAYAAIYLMPLEIDERAVGLLSVARLSGDPFDEEDLRLFQSLARHAAQALRNARLYRLEAEAVRDSRHLERFKSEMLAGVSHEFRLPLASISLATETLLAQQDAPQRDEIEGRLLRNILRSTHRLSGFVQDLLDLTRLEAQQLELRMRPFDLTRLAQDTAAHLESLCEMKGQTLRLDLAPGTWIIQGDEKRIEQVLSNLLTNAHQYTPEGGEIALSLAPTTGLHLDSPCGPEGWEDAIAIGIHDTGPGIPIEERANIFERFHQGEAGRRRSAGVGLGLYIARSVVELHGGCLWVGDNSMGGSTFWCLLPRTQAEEDAAEAVAPEEAPVGAQEGTYR